MVMGGPDACPFHAPDPATPETPPDTRTGIYPSARNGLTTHPPDNACEKTTTCCCKESRCFLLFHLEFNDKSVELSKRLLKEEMNRQAQ